MKTILFIVLGMLTMPAWSANECAGTPYQRLGKSCRDLGLDSNRAVCLPGNRYALYCDDTRQGQVRTCQSRFRCDGADRRDSRRGDRDRRHDDRGRYDGYRGGHDWWNDGWRHDNYGRRPGYRGHRGQGFDGRSHSPYVFFRGDWRFCGDLRFDRRGEPTGFCARGRENLDCRGNCERY